MCELEDKAMQAATAPREWWAVLDRDGYGDVYSERAEAERDAATYNESHRTEPYAPFRVAHLREVTP